ncbi:MAG: segregation/condensation protein A [bacterium]
MNYQIKLDNFEGPMDLLLHLIKREEMDIYDIPIAKVTRQYLEYIELLEILDLSLASDFMLMAAVLIQIKSKMLLPIENVNLEEEIGDDPRKALVASVMEYKKFKELAMELEKNRAHQEEIFTRLVPEISIEEENEFVEATLFDLLSAFKDAIKSVDEKAFHEIIIEEFTVADKIKEIKTRLYAGSGFYFSEIMEACRTKLEVIVTFIAILELIKQQEIQIRQHGIFGEIKVYRLVPQDELSRGTACRALA